MEYQQRLSFNRVGWERLSTRRKYFKLIMLHKMQNGLAPQYLSNMSLPLVSNIQSYPLRNAQRIRPPRTRTTRYERSFLPSAIQLWNSLPIELILMNSQIHFKKALNAHLFPQKVPPYWSYGERRVSIYHTRLRLRHSSLNAHLVAHGLGESRACECGHHTEDTIHYFFNCPRYAALRPELLASLDDTIAHIKFDLTPDF